ncbi:hypothetical protein GMD78_10980 [Ornithinibacillus sp. L9]|uniref:Uncharacterized protein n=1 Tax=Ornithinibacillus caprae TaxID=2678566 RepID=A0A6N8FLQ6_9BACI|nr:hypothetical protein [Ornithinibacillus caprae]MUK88917.1 hypothetical protein [Ornithinibacillus caprae]
MIDEIKRKINEMEQKVNSNLNRTSSRKSIDIPSIETLQQRINNLINQIKK